MGIFVSAVIGFAIWIILWALDVKALDGFLLAVAIILTATVVHMASPYMRRILKP